MLVTGGISSSYDLLSSTELMVGTASAWVFTGELPSPRDGLQGANIRNKIFMTGITIIVIIFIIYTTEISKKHLHIQFADKYLGGNDGSWSDEILEFDPLTGQWKEMDRMIQRRSYHAVSVVNYGEVAQYCSN